MDGREETRTGKPSPPVDSARGLGGEAERGKVQDVQRVLLLGRRDGV